MAERSDIAAPPPGCRGAAGGDGWRRWRLWRRGGGRPAALPLPLALLLLALSGLFLLGGDREYFYRGGLHDWNSSAALAFAANLSIRHNLLTFFYSSRDEDGKAVYPAPYNRFPAGGYALIKLATLPFGETDFRAQIYAARILTLLLWSAAAVLAYHALARIVGSRWDALTATLLAFASYYVLYYADKISNEVTIDLFAVMLAFHGMVVFMQESRFRQLLIKSCAALLLGWHVYAFLLPFIIFGMAAELLQLRQPVPTPPHILCNLKRYASTLRRSRYLLLGVVTLFFGVAILAFNFGNEYWALDGAVPFRELPSVGSAAKRLGLSKYPEGDATRNPAMLVPDQLYRMAVMTLPYAVNPYEIKPNLRAPLLPKYRPDDYPAIALGALTVVIGLVGLVSLRRRPAMAVPLATLVGAGFCWAGLVRHNHLIGHDYESVFYIGITLTVFTLGLLGARRWSRLRLSPYFAVAALGVFVFSAAEMAGVGQSRAELAVEDAQMVEYRTIRELVDEGRAIYAPHPLRMPNIAGAPYAAAYFLSGKAQVYNHESVSAQPRQADDYLLLIARADHPGLLTPDHRYVFLYDWGVYEQWRRRANREDTPIIADDWRVYLGDSNLTYVGSECAHREARFWLHLVPRSTADLPAGRREYGFDNRDFIFQVGGVELSDGTCVIERPLPDYDIVAIRTGQYTEAGRIWEGEYRLPAN